MNVDIQNEGLSGPREPTVLVIDDDPTSLALITTILREVHYMVLVAEDGESGLERAIHTRPDLILLDMLMPGMDGCETCRKLKASEAIKDIPVIFMTALADLEDKVRGFREGAVDYVTKPFRREELLARVAVHIHIRELTNKLKEANESLERRVEERSAELQAEIAQRRQTEEDLKKAHDELERRVEERTQELARANQALQDFAFIASHDMQEPLRKIMAFGDQLKTKFEDSLGETGLDYLERMQNAAKRMQALLSALLDYSRVGTTSDPFSPVDLRIVVHEVLSDLEVQIANKGARVEVTDLPVLEADPHQMRQLFQNLIANGLKFHRDELPVITISWQEIANDRYQILVKDNGIGFDEKFADRIFAPFERLHGRSKYEGAGIGLSICKKIVERHGGDITVRSTPGRGTTFIVTLPGRQA